MENEEQRLSGEHWNKHPESGKKIVKYAEKRGGNVMQYISKIHVYKNIKMK